MVDHNEEGEGSRCGRGAPLMKTADGGVSGGKGGTSLFGGEGPQKEEASHTRTRPRPNNPKQQLWRRRPPSSRALLGIIVIIITSNGNDNTTATGVLRPEQKCLCLCREHVSSPSRLASQRSPPAAAAEAAAPSLAAATPSPQQRQAAQPPRPPPNHRNRRHRRPRRRRCCARSPRSPSGTASLSPRRTSCSATPPQCRSSWRACCPGRAWARRSRARRPPRS